VITGIAHTAVCVPDVDAAVEWYRSVLGLTVLSPPYLVEGTPSSTTWRAGAEPVAVKAPSSGSRTAADRVLEVIEYPRVPGAPRGRTRR